MTRIKICDKMMSQSRTLHFIGLTQAQTRRRRDMATKTWTYFPIAGALAQLETILKPEEWRPINVSQSSFLRDFYYKVQGQVDRIPELTGVADRDVEAVNRFLKSKGFDIQLDPQTDGLYAASVLDVLVKWLKVGQPRDLRAANGNNYDGFLLNTDENGITYSGLTIDHEDNRLKMNYAEITTQSGDQVCFLIADGANGGQISPSTIEWLGEEIVFGRLSMATMACDRRNYQDMHIPMINLDQEVDISWLKGAVAIVDKGNDWYIAQALQQTKFRMNEVGARAESAVAVGMMRCMAVPMPRLVVDSPFFAWIKRPSLTRPLFVGYFGYDCWANPGSIE